MKLKFCGAAREVTGSKILITTSHGKRLLLDCGMFQGKGLETDSMNRDLGFDPSMVDHIILTHAHIDHSGLIPYVYRLGFRGSIICSNATRDLCSIMLADTAYIQEHDTKTFNKRRAKKGLPLVTPIFTQDDAKECMALFIGVPENMKFRIDDNIKVKFTGTGHMLGSGVANLFISENGKTTRLAYTGDIGRPSSRILAPPRPFPQAAPSAPSCGKMMPFINIKLAARLTLCAAKLIKRVSRVLPTPRKIALPTDATNKPGTARNCSCKSSLPSVATAASAPERLKISGANFQPANESKSPKTIAKSSACPVTARTRSQSPAPLALATSAAAPVPAAAKIIVLENCTIVARPTDASATAPR